MLHNGFNIIILKTKVNIIARFNLSNLIPPKNWSRNAFQYHTQHLSFVYTYLYEVDMILL